MSKQQLARSITLVMAANGLLALVAFAREVAFATRFGTSGEADAFLQAFFLPDLAGNLVLATGLRMAVVPILASYVAHNDWAGWNRALSALLRWVVLAGLLLALAGLIASPYLVPMMTGGFDLAARRLTLTLFRAMLPMVLLFPVAAVLDSGLQGRGHFLAPAAGPILVNVFLVLGVLMAAGRAGTATMAAAVDLGAVAALVILVPPLCRQGFRFRPASGQERALGRGLIGFLSLIVPWTLFLYAGPLAERILASTLQQGSVAALNYAYKLVQFPVWVFVAAVSTVVFPALSGFAAAGDRDTFRQVLEKGLQLVFFLAVPYTVVLWTLRRPLVGILFQYGAFGEAGAALTVTVLSTYALGISAQAVNYLLFRGFYAAGQVRVPLMAAALAAAATVATDLALLPGLGIAALGVGASLGAGLNAALLLWAGSRRLGLSLKAVLAQGGRTAVASVPLAVAAGFLSLGGPALVNLEPPLRVGYGLLAVLVLGLAYLGGCWWLRFDILRLLPPLRRTTAPRADDRPPGGARIGD